MEVSTTSRWEFTRTTPLGEERALYEFTPGQLRFQSDAPFGPGTVTLDWAEISEAATAVLGHPKPSGGRPDLTRWMPTHLEWLLVSRHGHEGRGFMQVLPTAQARDEIVAQLRERLGERFIGERQLLQTVQGRFGIGGRGETLRVAGLVVLVLAMLVGLLVLMGALLAVPFMDEAITLALGSWLLLGALRRARDVLALSGSRPTTLAAAPPGAVALVGRANCASPVMSGVTGQQSVWWEVGIDAWREQGGDGAEANWVQIAARHGGRTDALLFEDATGRVPVWLRDADLYLAEQAWESGKDALPAPGRALLDEAGFRWEGARLRVREQRVAIGAPLHVLGTLGRGADLVAAGTERAFAARLRWLRTGAWRPDVVRRIPAPLRIPVAVVIGYIGMLVTLGMGGARALDPEDAPAPPVAADAPVLWKGRNASAFVISDRAPLQARRALLLQAATRSTLATLLLGYWLGRLLG